MKNIGLITPLETDEEVLEILARRVSLERKRLKLTVSSLAKKADVKTKDLLRFEKAGKITFKNFIRIIRAFDATDIFENALHPPKFTTMEEFEAYVAAERERKRFQKWGPEEL